jgi:hypothetical protein
MKTMLRLAQFKTGWKACELTKRGILRSHAHDKHIEGYLGRANITLDLALIVNVYNLLLVVNLGSFGLVELDRRLLVSQEVAHGLHNGAMLDGAGSA